MIIRHTSILCMLFLVLLLLQDAEAFARYKIRKGGRLERLHKRTLTEWKRAHHKPRTHRHKRRRHERDGRMHIDHVVAHMDSFMRPRFGR